MKAGYWDKIGSLKVMDVPEPMVRPDQVKIQVAYCGICDNDIFIMEGNFPPLQPPMALGHEFSGTIVETGSDVVDFKVGQRVACNMQVFCGHCYYCHNGLENFCENVELATGAYAEYSVVSQKAVEVLPDDVSFKTGAFLEILSAAMYSVQRAEIEQGKTVAIFGGGTKAQLEVMLAVRGGASKIIVIEPDEEKRAMALRSGADVVVNPDREDVVEAVRAATDGRGADRVIESSAKADNCRVALEVANKCAVVNWAANYYMDDEIRVPLYTVRTDKCLTIRTSIQSPYLFQRGLSMLPRIDVESLISEIYPLDRLQEAFEKQASGKALKILIQP